MCFAKDTLSHAAFDVWWSSMSYDVHTNKKRCRQSVANSMCRYSIGDNVYSIQVDPVDGSSALKTCTVRILVLVQLLWSTWRCEANHVVQFYENSV